MSATPAAASTPSSPATTTTSTTATVTGSAYLEALAQFIKRHEAALASYNAPKPKPSSAPSPSWTTVLTLGIVPTTSEDTTSATARRGRAGKEPLVLRFDPHHLYYLLLKFDEIGLPSSSGDLDVRVEGGTTRPMVVSDLGESHQGNGDDDGVSLLGSIMFGRSRQDDDTRSIQSGMSSFSFGSGWWGLGGGDSKTKQPLVDEAATVRYIYSSCTKLPALQLSPFQMSTSLADANGRSRSRRHGDSLLSRVVEGFEDCPPPATCVPLTAFKNLSSLVLEDLDPRGFLGWDLLSFQLRSLAIHRGGIEDVGELICDAPAEDFARRAQPEDRRNKPVGIERRRRAEGANGSLLAAGHATEAELASSRPATPTTGSSSTDAPMYPTPPRLAWTSLRHLSLSDNSLTFIPSPPLTFLPTLTSLDLSSNLLITIPPALAHLTSLRSLDLSDNMIDSLLGIAKALGAIEVLNLSQNRIENLSGLDRLPALERLDVRSNSVYDVLEVSRLARLPHLREVWLAGNPLTASRLEGGQGDGDDKWRVKCFGYFAEEQALGHRDLDAGQICIDGKTMSSSERRALEAEYLSWQGRPLGFGFGLGRRQGSGDAHRGTSDRPAEARNGEQAKVVGRRVVTAPHRHPRVPSPPPSLPPASSAAARTALSSEVGAALPSRPDSPSSEELRRRGEKTPVKAKRRKPQRIVDLDAPPLGRSSADEGTTDSDRAVTNNRTEAALAASSSLSGELVGATESLDPRQQQRRSPRRDRVVPPMSYDAPPGDSSSSEAGSGGGGGGGEAFRRKIEALRSEVGESWLSVLSEREAREEQERREREVKAAAERKEEGRLGDLTKPDTVAKAHSPTDAKDSIPSRTPQLDADAAVTRRPPSPPPPPPHEVDPGADENPTGGATPSAPPPAVHPEPTATSASDSVAAQPTSGVEEETAGAEAATVVPTTVKSVRKKRGKGKKKGGGR